MHSLRNNPWTVARWLIWFTIAVSGCHNDPKVCNDIAPGAIPQPCGTYVCQWTHAETARADRDKLVIYRYEWSADPAKLTPGGREHLDALAERLAQSTCPVVIETSEDERLDAARREAIVNLLSGKNGLLGADRVTVGRPEAEGLYGQEAPGVASQMLGNVSGGGGTGATGGGAIGGGAIGATGGGATGSFGSGGGIGFY